MTPTDDTPGFDLVDAPWIRVRDLQGQACELGLADTLRRAHELAGPTGDVPTQVFAITRLLLAVLHPALDGPENIDAWAELWAADRLPEDRIDAYLKRWRHRFDLLHPTDPFFQVAGLHTGKGETSELSKLIADVPNGKPFFTTRAGGRLELSYAEATRWLVHCQAFDPSGIKSGCVGDDRVTGGRGYPIGVAWSGQLGGILAEGATLRETLLLNLLARTSGPFVHASTDDRPAWERDPDGAAQRVDPTPAGPLDLYTWQSRRVRLIAKNGAVTRVLIGNGDRITPQNRHDIEPHTAWRRSPAQEKKLGAPLVYMPRELDPERQIWRGLESMLPRTTTAQRADAAARLVPGVLEWVAELVNDGCLDPCHVVRVRTIAMIYGSNNSVTAEVVDDALSLRGTLLGRADELVGVATSCVTAADAAARCLSTLAGRLAEAAGGDDEGPRARALESAYAELDRPFRVWVAALTPDTDPTGTQQQWHATVRDVVRALAHDLQRRAPLEAFTGRLDRRGRLVNSPLADAWFRRDLRAALPLATQPSADAVATPA